MQEQEDGKERVAVHIKRIEPFDTLLETVRVHAAAHAQVAVADEPGRRGDKERHGSKFHYNSPQHEPNSAQSAESERGRVRNGRHEQECHSDGDKGRIVARPLVLCLLVPAS